MNFKAIVVLITMIVTSFLFSFLLASTANAQASGAHGPMIFDVRRSLPLEPEEPVFHDFYINAGPEAGFKKGQYITAVRPVPIQDPVLNKQQAILDVTVGYLQVIQVQRGITVARLFGELLDEERPALEFESVMIGDRIDLSSLTTKAPKVKSKDKPKPKSFFAQAAPAPAANVAPAAPIAAVSAPPAAAPVAADAQATTQASVQSPSPPAPQAPSPAPQTSSPAAVAQTAAPTGSTGTSAPAAPNGVPATQTLASNSPSDATTSGSSEKASPAANSPDMVRVPVPTSGSSN